MVPTPVPPTRFRFTKSAIESIPYTNSGQKLYWDEALPGLVLRVTRTRKVYCVEGRLNKKTKRSKIGSHTTFSPEAARAEARERLLRMSLGQDPQPKQTLYCSLERAFNDYVQIRRLKITTRHDYLRILKEAFSDWRRKALNEITSDMVVQRHRQLSTRSLARANNAMRVLRAVYNFYEIQIEEQTGQAGLLNPVRRLSRLRLWNTINPRGTYIANSRLGAWMLAVSRFTDRDGGDARDFLLTMLFTGLRPGEAAALEWSNVDLTDGWITIPNPKNKVPHRLPIASPLLGILRKRAATDSKFVFSSRTQSGYIGDIRKRMAQISASCGTSFMRHDLRRTFISIADGLDLSPYVLKRLLNHKARGDVTAGYIQHSPERLREVMERISNRILEAAGLDLDTSGADFKLLQRETA
jgi:integrase